jgi:purine-binding chemotaxis protein CheW
VTTYVRLRLAEEEYAVPVTHVREVIDLAEVVPVPGTPGDVIGVMNLRGQILPVIDLTVLIGIERTAPPRLLLIAESNGQQAGLALDEVSGIAELPDPATDSESDLLSGSLLAGTDLIGVIDVPRVFSELERARP